MCYKKLLIVTSVLLFFVCVCESKQANRKSQMVTSAISQILQNYDRKLRPGNQGNKAIKVGVDIKILSLGEVSESKMEFSLHCYFRQIWRDPRLQFDAGQLNDTHHIVNRSRGQENTLYANITSAEVTYDDDDAADTLSSSSAERNDTELTSNKSAPILELPLNARVLDEIWRPDTYIMNGKHSYLHKLTVPNRLLRIRSDGLILLSQRLTITARCLMQLRRFPMDTQQCTLEIGSLGYSSHEIFYKWKDIKCSETEHSQFTLARIDQSSQLIPNSMRLSERSSVLIATLILNRNIGYYVLQIYVPSSMIVMLSWVSFWINQEAAIARCSLGVMTVMTLTTLRIGVRDELPPVHYPTAIDVFLFVSFGFVLAALVEYIVIHYTALVHRRKMNNLSRRAKTLLATPMAGPNAARYFSRAHQKSEPVLSRIRSIRQRAGSSRSGIRIVTTAPDNDESQPTVETRLLGRQPSKLSVAGEQAYRDFQQQLSFLNQRVRAISLAQRDGEDREEEGGEYCEEGGEGRQPRWSDKVTRQISLVDDWSKALFPAAYVLFHVGYWLLYIFYADDE